MDEGRIQAKPVDVLECRVDEGGKANGTILDLWRGHPQIGGIRLDYCSGMTRGALASSVSRGAPFSPGMLNAKRCSGGANRIAVRDAVTSWCSLTWFVPGS